MLWIVKLTITPLIVGLVSLAARKWGPTAGGLMMALPWMTGPILLFLALERGPEFARDMAIGIELGAAGIGAWAIAYAAPIRRTAWPVCLLLGFATFAIWGWIVGAFPFSLWGSALLGYACLLGGFLAIPRPVEPDMIRALPWWDIPVRMLSTALLVALIMTTSGLLGPQYSGIAATYPVIATVMTAFTHRSWGAAAAIRLLRAMLLSLQGFVTFFLIVGLAIVPFGVVVAFSAAVAAALLVSALLMVLARRGLVKT